MSGECSPQARQDGFLGLDGGPVSQAGELVRPLNVGLDFGVDEAETCGPPMLSRRQLLGNGAFSSFTEEELDEEIILGCRSDEVLGSEVGDGREWMQLPDGGLRVMDVEVGQGRSTRAAIQSVPRELQAKATYSENQTTILR